MLSVIIIAKTISGLSVGPIIKRQLSDCTFYGQQYSSRPVLFKRFDKCYKELVDAKSSGMRSGYEQIVQQPIRQGERDSVMATGRIAKVYTPTIRQARIIDERVASIRGQAQDNDEPLVD